MLKKFDWNTGAKAQIQEKIEDDRFPLGVVISPYVQPITYSVDDTISGIFGDSPWYLSILLSKEFSCDDYLI